VQGDEARSPGLRVLLDVAREAVRARLERRPAAFRARVDAAGPLARAAPVFVTLRLDGDLRGCMGELVPRFDDLVREVADRAVVAAFEDPRFPPLARDELERITFEVSILGPLEPVSDRATLDPRRYGIEVFDRSGRRAVLLPGIEGIDTVDEQIRICRRKAGIRADAPISLHRFEVIKVSGEDSR